MSSASGSEAASLVASEDPMRFLLLPVTLILVVGLCSAFGLLGYFGYLQDRAALQAWQANADSAMDHEEEDLSRIVRDLAVRVDTVARLVKRVDPALADAIIGSYQTENNGIAASFIVDKAGRTVVSFLHGESANADAFAALTGGLDQLVAYARNSPRGTSRPATGVLMFEGRPHLVAAAVVQGSTGLSIGAARSVLVMARPLDPAFIARLGREFDLKDLRLLGDRDHSLGATLPLTSPSGQPVARLSWSPDLPARRLFVAFAPVVGAVGAAMVALFWSFLHRARRLGIRLARQAKIFDHIRDAIVVTDIAGTITGWNGGAERTFGYGRAEVMGRSIAILQATDVFAEIERIARSFEDTGTEHGEMDLVMRRKNGEAFPAHLSLSPIRNEQGRAIGTVGYAIDISERKKLEARLEQLATVDELTGAFNRRHLLRHGPIEIQRALRFKRPLSVLFLDLDHFKRINDRLGHAFGDMVLAVFCETCRKILRTSDVFVRFGGEEFVALLPETDLEHAKAVALRLAERVRQTVVSADPPLRAPTVSIGITALRGRDDSLEAVLARADKATYRAKELGRDRIEVLP